MAKSLQEILGGRNMTGVVQTVATGLPNYVPDAFQKVTRRVVGNKSSYLKVTGQRANARLNAYGSPARVRSKLPLSDTGVTHMHLFEEQSHDPIVLQNLLGQNGGPAQDLAVEEIDRQTKGFKQIFANARLSAIYSILCLGKIHADGEGNLLYSASGAVTTIDYGVPAGNLNQISALVTASWGTAGTDIIGNINNIKKKAVQATGRELAYAFYGPNILGYLLGNTAINKLFNANPVLLNSLYQTGEIPDGFMGLKWRPAYRAFGLNTSDAVTDWWGVDQITFCPEPTEAWWKFEEGSYLVPRNIGNVNPDVVASMTNVDQVYGMFGYAVVGHNPVTVTQYGGDTFMPILASPNDLYIADVTP